MDRTDRRALIDGSIAVVAFAATLPLTRIALEGFSPQAMSFARLLGASVCALLALNLARAPLPQRHQLPGLAMVALGGVLGFPLLTAFALQDRPAAPAAIALALMPLATAAWARLRGHERPDLRFWQWAAAGSAGVLLFVSQQGAMLAAPELLGAGIAAAIAYAEGGRLARRMPGWQVMGWALMLVSPLSALGFGYSWAQQPLRQHAAPWLALAFLAVITQFGAFWFWYRALAAGVARGGQLQLLQPFITLLMAAWLLGESLDAELWLYAAAVVASVHFARNAGPRFNPNPEETQP